MSTELIVTVVTILGSLLGGAFGVKLLDRWFDRDRQLAEQSGAQTQRAFADNEQARIWLRTQLDEAEKELRAVRENERALMVRMGELAAQVARQEERTNAQAARIDDLSTTVARLGADYAEMKAERDSYRDAKHAAENRLTTEILGRQLAEKDRTSLAQEVERLRGQLDARTTKDGPS